MDYLETSYVLALAVKTDINHRAALALEKTVRDPVISELVLVETYTYFSRTLTPKAGVPQEEFENMVEAMARYTVRRSQARIASIDADELLEQAKRYAPKIRLRTLDLLHLLAAKQIGANRIVTLDHDYARKAGQVRRWLNIEVMAPNTL